MPIVGFGSSGSPGPRIDVAQSISAINNTALCAREVTLESRQRGDWAVKACCLDCAGFEEKIYPPRVRIAIEVGKDCRACEVRGVDNELIGKTEALSCDIDTRSFEDHIFFDVHFPSVKLNVSVKHNISILMCRYDDSRVQVECGENARAGSGHRLPLSLALINIPDFHRPVTTSRDEVLMLCSLGSCPGDVVDRTFVPFGRPAA